MFDAIPGLCPLDASSTLTLGMALSHREPVSSPQKIWVMSPAQPRHREVRNIKGDKGWEMGGEQGVCKL